jgi:hypothetical protein
LRVLCSTPTTQATKGGRWGGGSAPNFRAHVPFGAAALQRCWQIGGLGALLLRVCGGICWYFG